VGPSGREGGGASAREKVGQGGPRAEGESADARERGAWAGIGPAEEGKEISFFFLFSLFFFP
jgi:hypothetical protein